MTLSPALFLILLGFHLSFCTSTDTIASTDVLQDSQTIVSNGESFKLQFFSPANTTKRYLGILFNFPVMTPIWVANRDKPLNDTLGSMTIADDGNLVVLDGQKNVVWSSSVGSSPGARAQLLDSGKLVLLDNSTGKTLWQSFQHLGNSFVQTMTLSTDQSTGEKLMLTSWKSDQDASIGNYTYGVNPLNVPELVLLEGNRTCWRSGPWNAQVFIGIPTMSYLYGSGFTLTDNRKGYCYTSFTSIESILLYYTLTYEGVVLEKTWFPQQQNWNITWSTRQDDCDDYGKCGPNGICNPLESPICSCLHGYVPKDTQEWSKGNWTGGCVRRTLLKCQRNISNGENVKDDGFWKVPAVKVPYLLEWTTDQVDNCSSQCLRNCSCIAYAFANGVGCMQWSGSLIDTKKFSINSGADLYVRVAYTELGKKRSIKRIVISIVIVVSLVSAIAVYIACRCIARKRGRRRKSELSPFGGVKSSSDDISEVTLGNTMHKVKLSELQIFTFEKLINATGDFDQANKLGEGGFGPVFKGKLLDGRELAVKRLSRSSGQGMEEFMNEVLVISKLQHRNLVRLLGCCVEREEKMLIYEYMPNGGLDSLLFDSNTEGFLDWVKRVNIIEGIGRGLLYLHRDSRLRIIHRDLKASNILLDHDLNPKISDFGMARIFGGNQDQANTGRVVGTYGYMAPEYAMEGRFSEKSDVYSFGVLLLEIMSGRKNSSFCNDEDSWSLLQYAWKLWNEGKILEFIDQRISDPNNEKEFSRYMNVGLLCVQEYAIDRPGVSTVLSMLSSEIVDLPTTKQPAFTSKPARPTEPLLSQSDQSLSINDYTITSVEAR